MPLRYCCSYSQLLHCSIAPSHAPTLPSVSLDVLTRHCCLRASNSARRTNQSRCRAGQLQPCVAARLSLLRHAIIMLGSQATKIQSSGAAVEHAMWDFGVLGQLEQSGMDWGALGGMQFRMSKSSYSSARQLSRCRASCNAAIVDFSVFER
jgi:hypothetical protein